MKKISFGFIFVISFALSGCIYSSNFGPGFERTAVLYDETTWAKDTGWSIESLQGMTVPIWNTPYGANRVRVGELPLGASVAITSSSQRAYQVQIPGTNVIGWLDKAYVKRTIVNPFSEQNVKPIANFSSPVSSSPIAPVVADQPVQVQQPKVIRQDLRQPVSSQKFVMNSNLNVPGQRVHSFEYSSNFPEKMAYVENDSKVIVTEHGTTKYQRRPNYHEYLEPYETSYVQEIGIEQPQRKIVEVVEINEANLPFSERKITPNKMKRAPEVKKVKAKEIVVVKEEKKPFKFSNLFKKKKDVVEKDVVAEVKTKEVVVDNKESVKESKESRWKGFFKRNKSEIVEETESQKTKAEKIEEKIKSETVVLNNRQPSSYNIEKVSEMKNAEEEIVRKKNAELERIKQEKLEAQEQLKLKEEKYQKELEELKIKLANEKKRIKEEIEAKKIEQMRRKEIEKLREKDANLEQDLVSLRQKLDAEKERIKEEMLQRKIAEKRREALEKKLKKEISLKEKSKSNEMSLQKELDLSNKEIEVLETNMELSNIDSTTNKREVKALPAKTSPSFLKKIFGSDKPDEKSKQSLQKVDATLLEKPMVSQKPTTVSLASLLESKQQKINEEIKSNTKPAVSLTEPVLKNKSSASIGIRPVVPTEEVNEEDLSPFDLRKTVLKKQKVRPSQMLSPVPKNRQVTVTPTTVEPKQVDSSRSVMVSPSR